MGEPAVALKPESPPAVIPRSLDELVALGEGDLKKLTKAELIRTLVIFKQGIQEHLRSVTDPAEEELTDKDKLAAKKAELLERVDLIMDDYPIQYSSDFDHNSKRTTPVARNILYALAMGCSLKDAAFLAGVSYQFMQDWRKDDPEGFASTVDAAQATFNGLVVNDAVLRLLVGGEVKRIRKLYRDGELDSEIIDLTTSDARVAIAAKSRFRQTTEHHGQIDHVFRFITPEREAILRKHGNEIVYEEIKALGGQGREES